MLQRRWLFIVLAGLLGTTLALLGTVAQTPKFTAQADAFVTVTSGQSTGDLAQGSTFAQDQARNFAAVVTKEIVLGPVIKQFGLTASLDDLRKRITVEVPLNTSVINIQYTDPDPAMAAAIANSLAQNLSAAVKDLSPTVSDVKGSPVRAELIESATVPEKPSSPNVPLFAMLGLLGGLVLAIAYLVVVELVVAKVDSAEQVESLTQSTVLASIPRDRRLSRHPIAITALPLSLRAESIRHARTALKFLPGKANQTYVFTSSVSGEGKSTTAANIAAAFAAEGSSTCLVEADLRRPRLEGLLDLTGGPGLSDIVVGQTKIEDTLQSWGPDGLQVILVGTVPPNASELLGSTRGQDALKAITEMFDVTIIDTPPLTAVTDAAIIGRVFGGVVMVVGGGKVRTSELMQARAALTVADVPVRGTVLNLAKEDASRPYAYSYADQSRDAAKLATILPKGWRPVIKAAAAIIAAIAVAATTVMLTNRPVAARASVPGASQSATANAPTASPAASSLAKRVAFIGDAVVGGTQNDATKGWAAPLTKAMGWTEVNLTNPGTGYLKSAGKNVCGQDFCPPFPMVEPAAAAAKPDVVIVSGGLSDVGNDVSTAAKTLFTALRSDLPQAQIIVVSPPGRSTGYPADLAAVRDEVKAAAKAAGVSYIDLGNPLAGRPDLYSDQTTPNASGSQVLADALTKAIRKL